MTEMLGTESQVTSDRDVGLIRSETVWQPIDGTLLPRREATVVIPVAEERLSVDVRRVDGDRVRVGTRTEVVGVIAEAEVDGYRVEVTRVPVGRVVDEVPLAWAEGDVTTVPVVEERLVLVKKIVLVEEVRVRHVVERETVREPVALRRQHVVERSPTGDDGISR